MALRDESAYRYLDPDLVDRYEVALGRIRESVAGRDDAAFSAANADAIAIADEMHAADRARLIGR